MKTWRQQLQELGGWDNELVSIPAGAVRKIIEELEAAQAELTAMTADRDSWERQASDRADDVLAAAQRADKAQAELAAMKQQEPVAWRLMDDFCSGDFEYNTIDEFSYGRTGGQPLYLAPQPTAQTIPVAAIDSILTEVMDNAVQNGADSRSMPDEYVEVAAWLCGVKPSQPAEGAMDAALENCRLFAARNRNEEWAKTVLRFCADAGKTGSVLRNAVEVNALGYLEDLVKALDVAFISSWQSTAAWQKQLDAARAYIDEAMQKGGA